MIPYRRSRSSVSSMTYAFPPFPGVPNFLRGCRSQNPSNPPARLYHENGSRVTPVGEYWVTTGYLGGDGLLARGLRGGASERHRGVEGLVPFLGVIPVILLVVSAVRVILCS